MLIALADFVESMAHRYVMRTGRRGNAEVTARLHEIGRDLHAVVALLEEEERRRTYTSHG